jgi:hypothetical protein
MAARPNITLIALIVVLFVLLPTFGDGFMAIFHNPVIIFLMLGLLLWMTTHSPGLGVLGLLLVGGIFLERNRRTLFTAYRRGSAPRMTQDMEMPVSPSVRFVSYERPSITRSAYEPAAGCEGNEFAPVAPSINEKRPLETVPPGAATGPVLLRAFAT